jgi:thiamine-phosphate pyrophosphorylase
LLPITRAGGVPLIINDHPLAVAATGAEGVHIGQEDGSVAEARMMAGAGAWVGKSTHSLAQAKAAADEGADYLGFGPLFATPTKPDYTPIGVAEIRKVHELVRAPIFCIGGIKLKNLRDVLAVGARRVVIVSGFLQADNPGAAVREAKEQVLSFPGRVD